MTYPSFGSKKCQPYVNIYNTRQRQNTYILIFYDQDMDKKIVAIHAPASVLS